MRRATFVTVCPILTTLLHLNLWLSFLLLSLFSLLIHLVFYSTTHLLWHHAPDYVSYWSTMHSFFLCEGVCFECIFFFLCCLTCTAVQQWLDPRPSPETGGFPTASLTTHSHIPNSKCLGLPTRGGKQHEIKTRNANALTRPSALVRSLMMASIQCHWHAKRRVEASLSRDGHHFQGEVTQESARSSLWLS